MRAGLAALLTERRRQDDGAAADATWVPYSFWFDGFDPTSEESCLAFPPDRLARSKAALESWVFDETAEWITPESARKWEGMEHGQA